MFLIFRSQLPARATRLLNRRLQNNNISPLSQNGSDSPRSLDSMHSRNTPTKTSLREHLIQRQQLHLQSQLLNSSSEDLVVDKSLRNSMLQDVACFQKQLVQLRRILQEVSIFILDIYSSTHWLWFALVIMYAFFVIINNHFCLSHYFSCSHLMISAIYTLCNFSRSRFLLCC